MEGRVTGLADGALVGWIAAANDGQEVYLEVVAPDGAPFGRARATPGEDGRLHFAIPVPEALRDGRMRFLDVRPIGSPRPLDGGPVIYDGGLFTPVPAQEQDACDRPAPPLAIEGQVRFIPPNVVEGWAKDPDAPERRLRLELVASGRLVAAFTADQAQPGDGHGFRVDLSRLLRRGPHEVTIRVEGFAEPLPQGKFRVGPFAPDGEVDCPGYLDDAESRAVVAGLPFEHLAFDTRRVAPARLAPRLINRLRRERLLLAGAGAPAPLLLALPGASGAADLWALQSLPGPMAQAADGPEAIRAAAAGAAMVFLARPGDLLHPSAGAVLARLEGADAVLWGRFCADSARAGSGGTVLRRPVFDAVTARHGALTDSTLAIRGEVLARAPGPVLQALSAGRLHPLWFWLAGQGLSWRLHPEALTSSIGSPPPAPSREEVMVDEAFYRALLAEEGGEFTLETTAEDLPFPFVLVPSRRANTISVLVPFRDRSAMTLRCIHALARQRLSGELELVLVDNQSAPEEAAAVLEGARRLLGEERVTSLAYDAPFNHSAQNNLAARAARGEAIVICNNDVVLADPDALEQLAAWALQPGVGAVGCRLHDPDRGIGSHGLRYAPPSADPFYPPLREEDDEAWGGHVHASPGATLALAAIDRQRFLDLGGLDETRFPVGYNDLDLMLRATRQGLRHLYLGHVRAEHVRGSSRSGDNEDLQALWLNQDHPAALTDRLAQLERIRLEAETDAAKAGASDAEAEELARLQAEVDARRGQEIEREALAGRVGNRPG